MDSKSKLTTTTLPERAVGGPSLAVKAETLGSDAVFFMAWQGTDQHLNLARSGGGTSWIKQTLSERGLPGIAASDEALYLAWSGTDGRLNILAGQYSPDGSVAFGSKITLDIIPYSALSLAVLGKHVYMVWRSNEDSSIHMMSSGDGFNTRNEIAISDKGNPSIASDGRQLYLVWGGLDDGHFHMKTSSNGVDFGGTVNLNIGSKDFTPALADFGGLYIAWRTDQVLNLNWRDPSGHITSDTNTSAWWPSVGSSVDMLLIAWTGTDADNHLNVGVVKGGPSPGKREKGEKAKRDIVDC